MKKNSHVLFFIGFGIFVFVCPLVFNLCSHSSEEKEEAAQIEEVERLSQQPTYYVDSISCDNEIYTVSLRRETDRTDGTLPGKMTVTFYEKYTPSVAYLGINDSIKVDIYDLNEENRIEGRYVTTTTYEANLFVFVDQIPVLLQKSYNKK